MKHSPQVFILLVSFSFKQNSSFHRNKTIKFCRFSAKVKWIINYLWKKPKTQTPKLLFYFPLKKNHAFWIQVNFNKVRLSSNRLKVYYRWNLILQYYALHIFTWNSNNTINLPWATTWKDKLIWGQSGWIHPWYFWFLSIPSPAQIPAFQMSTHPPCQI